MKPVTKKLVIADVNTMSHGEFIRTFGQAVDGGDFLAAAVWRHRPFDSLAHLQNAFCDFMADLPLAGKEAILRLMPDITGKSVKGEQLSKESIAERCSAGLYKLTKSETKTIVSLNERYTSKFGFHFVCCARVNKSAFMEELVQRIENIPEVEVVVGLNEAKKIWSTIGLNIRLHYEAYAIDIHCVYVLHINNATMAS